MNEWNDLRKINEALMIVITHQTKKTVFLPEKKSKLKKCNQSCSRIISLYLYFIQTSVKISRMFDRLMANYSTLLKSFMPFYLELLLLLSLSCHVKLLTKSTTTMMIALPTFENYSVN